MTLIEAVAKAIQRDKYGPRGPLDRELAPTHNELHTAEVVLAALTAAGYAVVALPEGVAVNHGARLVKWPTVKYGNLTLYAFAIEPPEKGCYCGERMEHKA